MKPIRGEVWLFDLGMVEKVRPAPVISEAYGDSDRALITIVPHTTSLRGSQYEIAIEVAFLRPGAFLVQNVATYPNVRAIRRLGKLKRDEFNLIRRRRARSGERGVLHPGWIGDAGDRFGHRRVDAPAGRTM